jgi:small subunit ribosomal protein S16
VAVRIRLRRLGAKKRPFYRVVVADQRSPRDGRFIEAIGKYHPLEDPSLIEIDEERALEWLRKGAQPSEAVQTLMTKVGIWEKFEADRPQAANKRSAQKASKAAKAGTTPTVKAAPTTAATSTKPAS